MADGWEGRLREAAYTSPLGGRAVFQYEDVSRTTPLKNAAFDFPNVQGSYVQPNGYGARQYPLRCFFSGPDCDVQADLFEELLLDVGVGRLEHPLYGVKDVVPFGEVTRTDALKSGANQSIVETTFWETVGALYPSSSAAPAQQLNLGLDSFLEAAASAFAEQTNLTSTIAKANTKATVGGLLQYVSAALSAVSAVTLEASRAFQAGMAALNGGLDVLVGQPVLLAQQVVNLTLQPSRALAGIESRLLGYRNLLATVLASAPGSGAQDATTQATLRLKRLNDFATVDLVGQAAVSGSVSSALNTTFTTKPQALATASEIASQLDALVGWRDGRLAGLSQIDPGVAYQALQQLVALALGYLVETSFTLATEKRITLDRPRTIVDLCAELYGTVDDKLDFLCETNNLTGAEILELPIGRSIVFYV